MDLAKGLLCNFRGLWLGMRSPRLLFWGLLRFFLAIIITFALAGLILAFHQEIMELLWSRPESRWTLWLWYLLSWLVSLFLVALSAVFSYLISQIFFSVLIMDHMSRITEAMMTGDVRAPAKMPFWALFLHLVRQEIPRAVIPILLSFLLLIMGWLIALGPLFIFISSAIAVIFLSWDNTDLVPARQLIPFKERFRILLKNLLFHLGFGLPFLVPILNLFFLSFAPIGATIFHIERDRSREGGR
ncbi:MAG: EI24 domain-containing protein [Desulfobacterales bacterium]|nr:EI24 domain-containing protein [Desulfobacterales bacterium]